MGVKMEPKVVTDTDEAELSKELARLEQMNAEVDGDDSADEDDEDGSGDEEDEEGGEEGERRVKRRRWWKMEMRENFFLEIVGSFCGNIVVSKRCPNLVYFLHSTS